MKKTLNKFKDLRFNQSEKSIRDDSYKPFLATPEWFNKKTIKEENKIEETDVLAILKQKEGKSILFNQMELNYAKKKFFIVLEICATLEKHFVNYIKSNGDELNLSCKVGDIDFNDWKIILETKCRTLLKICEINKEVEFSINCLDLKDSLLLDSLDTISYFDDDSLFILKAEICLKFEKFNEELKVTSAALQIDLELILFVINVLDKELSSDELLDEDINFFFDINNYKIVDFKDI